MIGNSWSPRSLPTYKEAHGTGAIKTRAVAGALADYMQDAENEIDNMRQAAQEDDQVLDPAWEAGAFVKPFPISMILREAPGIDVTKVPADQKINKPIFFKKERMECME